MKHKRTGKQQSKARAYAIREYLEHDKRTQDEILAFVI